MKLSQNIAYKIQLISQKLQKGEELSYSEREYLNKYKRHLEHLSSYQIELELKQFDINSEEIEVFLNTRETKTDLLLKNVDSQRKTHALELNKLRIAELRKDLNLLKHYIEDTFPYERLSIDRYITELINNDSYTASEECLKKYDLIFVNSYTGEITFNEPTLNLAYEIMDGNMGNYLLLKSYEKRVQGVSPEELIEEYNKLPKKIKGATIASISRIINYCNQSIPGSLFNSKDILEFIKKVMDMKNGKFKKEYTDEILAYTKETIIKYINGEITRNDLQRYHVLNYFNLDISNKKFKMLLSSSMYNLDVVLNKIKNDELIKRTRLNSEVNGFFDSEGYPYLPNISLACEIINDDLTNYNKLLDYIKTGDQRVLESIPNNLRTANPLDMERIIYYGQGRIGNPSNHELESSLYNLEVLKAIATEQSRPTALTELNRLKAA